MPVRPGIASLLAVAALTAAAARCSAPAQPARPTEGGVLRVGLAAAPDALVPYLGRNAESVILANRVLPRLAQERLPDEHRAAGLAPEVASAWELADGGRTLRVRLRPARWNDGSAITCADVSFTLAAARNPYIGWPGARGLAEFGQPECRSDSELVIPVTRPNSAALRDLAELPLLSRSLAAKPFPAWHAEPFASIPAGRAFQVREGTRGGVLERNPLWEGPHGPARLAGIELRAIPDPTARMNELLAGRIDLADALLPGNAARLTADAGVRVLRRRGWSYVYVGWMTLDHAAYAGYRAGREPCTDPARCPDLAADVAALARNHPHPLFGEAGVRRALTLAIDRQGLTELLFRGEAEVPASPLLAPLQEHDPARDALPFDVPAARALLAAAGFADHDGDGTLDRNGRPFAFELAYPSGSALRREVAVAIQRDLGRVGIVVTPRVLEPAEFYAALAARRLDAWIGSWPATLDLDLSRFLGADGCGDDGSNYGAFVNDDLDAAARAASDASLRGDRAGRIAAARRWESVFLDQQPYTILFRPHRLIGVSNRVVGAESATAVDPLAGVEEWWLDDTRR